MANTNSNISFFSKVDEYGFERPEDFDYATYEEFMSQYLVVLAKRARKWQLLVGEGRSLKRNLTVKRYVRKGVPSEHRGQVWLAVSGAELLREKYPSDFYQRLLDAPKDQDIVEIIQTDLPRTFPDNIFFKPTFGDDHDNALQKLYNVLIAYAHDNKEVGYCQGLNYIAGLLLIVTKSEENTFWLLKVLVEKRLPKYYTPSMLGVIVDIAVLEQLIKLKLPDVYRHVKEVGLPWAVITTKWFICLFAEVLPTETVLRIWDCLFYEGSKIIFRVCLTLVKRNRDSLLRCEDFISLAECFKEITKDSLVLQCHEFMQSIFKTPGSLPANQIDKLRTKMEEKQKSGS